MYQCTIDAFINDSFIISAGFYVALRMHAGAIELSFHYGVCKDKQLSLRAV